MIYDMKSPGETVRNHRIGVDYRYGMIGDRYMTCDQIGERMDELNRRANLIDRPGWCPEIAVRYGLAHDGISYLKSLEILAKAHVTWADICYSKS